ncbi:MAG: 2-oxoacid:acceptor oxidoreductase subunit alpha [Patescibacteria group bacterium]|jgi:2-oxoglutarate ferredoxin oxidoreductase subunit alpha
MIVNNFNWKIGGEAGYGILSAGAMFARAMLRAGLYVFDYAEYPSLIRGGHNTYEVSSADEEVYSVRRPVNILVALNQETIEAHTHELSPDAAIIYNSDNIKIDHGNFPASMHIIGAPLEDLAVKAGAEKVARNVVALGVSFALLGLPFKNLQEIITLNFGMKKKAENIVTTNIDAAKAGYDFLLQNFKKEFNYQFKLLPPVERLLMEGNHGIVWGAIKAGCKFLSAYPMTPATSILGNMAAVAERQKLVVQHTEDEISAINAAIGAAYTGVRAMTATSGGGFCLMTEAWGMAGMVEVPLVVVEAMRTGPSTGLPTWGGQDDLKFLLSASHGEFPRFVIAPGDVEQCYNYIQEAFNLAEKYQSPVMFITDKFLASSHKWVEKKLLKDIKINRGAVLTEKDLAAGKNYLRYKDTASGVSPRTLPGTKGGEHIANSDEHNEMSFSEESAEERTKMMDKRFRKEATAKKELPTAIFEGEHKADITLISWGSNRGPILEAMRELKKENIKVNFLQIIYISPFPVEQVKEIFKKAKKVAVVEQNKTGQLAGWIREQTGLAPDYKILKYDGRPFFVQELVQTIKEIK